MRQRQAGGLGRDFWLYFAGQTLSQLGGSFTQFALPLLVYKLTHSPTNLALTTVSEFVPYLLFGLILGAIVDRADRKRLMLRTDVARGLVIATLPVLYLAGVLRVEYIYAVGFVQATLGIIFDTGEFAAIPSLVGRRDLVTANARIMATQNAGQVLGPLLAGAIVVVLPVAELFFVDAGSFVLSALTLSFIGVSFNAEPSEAPTDGASRVQTIKADVKAGLSYVLRNPVLRTISIMMALINFVATTEWTQLVLFAKRALHASDTEVSGLFAAGSAGVVLVSLLAGPIRRRLSFRVTALGALVVSGLATSAMALVGEYWAALAFWAMSSGFGLLLNINTGALRQAIVPPDMFGRVISIAGVLAWSANPLGALAGAAVIKATGNVTAVYIGTGLLVAAIAVAFNFSPIKHGDRYLAEADAQRAPTADEVAIIDTAAMVADTTAPKPIAT